MKLRRLTLVLATLFTLHGARPAIAASLRSSDGPAPLAGHWQGQWVRDGASLDVWVDFSRSDSGYVGSFGSDALRALEIPFQSVRSDSAGVHWFLVGDATTSRFDGRITGDELSGMFKDGDAPGTIRLRRTTKSTTPPYATEEVRFANGAVTLAGTLMMPAGPEPHPAIVFVHGSGPEGRYASRYLADRLTSGASAPQAATGSGRHSTTSRGTRSPQSACSRPIAAFAPERSGFSATARAARSRP